MRSVRGFVLADFFLRKSRWDLLVCVLISDFVSMELINNYVDESETSGEGLRNVDIRRYDCDRCCR